MAVTAGNTRSYDGGRAKAILFREQGCNIANLCLRVFTPARQNSSYVHVYPKPPSSRMYDIRDDGGLGPS